jgi:hypothetical protein
MRSELGAVLLRIGAMAMLAMTAVPAFAAGQPICGGRRDQPPLACHGGGACVLADRRAAGKRLPAA